MRTFIAAAMLSVLFTAVHADSKPAFPEAPVGFDDGRVALEKDLARARSLASTIVERALEEATPQELASFFIRHLLADELASLDTLLALKGQLSAQTTTEGVLKVLAAAKLDNAKVIRSLGEMLNKRGYTALQAAAWLYARNFNARAITGAMDRGTNAARKLRAFLESKESASAAAVFERAFWEYDLRDASGIAGGHYDSTQMIESMLELGVDHASWAKALGQVELTALQKQLIAWGDAGVMAQGLEGRASERDFHDAAAAFVSARAKDEKACAAIHTLAMRRSTLAQRWFRTAGADVLGVYRGPWNAEAAPPITAAMGIGDLHGSEFAEGLTESLRGCFKTSGAAITLVLYEDGSARAALKLEQSFSYGADTPLGNGASKLLLFEGRATQRGKSALLKLVFAEGLKPPLSEIEIEGFGVTTNGAFCYGQATAEEHSAPLLLRRVSRNIDPALP